MEWWMAQKDVKLELVGTLSWNEFNVKLKKKFMPHA
jgi:hypothetical protein